MKNLTTSIINLILFLLPFSLNGQTKVWELSHKDHLTSILKNDNNIFTVAGDNWGKPYLFNIDSDKKVTCFETGSLNNYNGELVFLDKYNESTIAITSQGDILSFNCPYASNSLIDLKEDLNITINALVVNNKLIIASETLNSEYLTVYIYNLENLKLIETSIDSTNFWKGDVQLYKEGNIISGYINENSITLEVRDEFNNSLYGNSRKTKGFIPQVFVSSNKTGDILLSFTNEENEIPIGQAILFDSKLNSKWTKKWEHDETTLGYDVLGYNMSKNYLYDSGDMLISFLEYNLNSVGHLIVEKINSENREVWNFRYDCYNNCSINKFLIDENFIYFILNSIDNPVVSGSLIKVKDEFAFVPENGENNNDNFTIYPNPSGGITYIEAPYKFDLTIYNANGQLIYRNSDIKKQTLTLSTGTYIAKAKGNGKAIAKKFIVW